MTIQFQKSHQKCHQTIKGISVCTMGRDLGDNSIAKHTILNSTENAAEFPIKRHLFIRVLTREVVSPSLPLSLPPGQSDGEHKLLLQLLG